MRVCLFDIDGTLLASGGAGKAAMEAALVEEFGLAAATYQVSYSGRTDRGIMLDLLRRHALEVHDQHYQRLISGYLQRLPDCLARHQGRVLPGIQPLLEHLAAREDVAVGLLTGNLRAGASLKLGHYGLLHHFRFGGYGDEHLDRDDVAREALAEVHRHFDDTVHAEDVWVIGDTPLDVRCARAIGAKIAAVATGWHSLEELRAAAPDLVMSDLKDAEPLLALLKQDRA
jgi:phosphoglycolate phosphatase-like HAD superfamily hydrolase